MYENYYLRIPLKVCSEYDKKADLLKKHFKDKSIKYTNKSKKIVIDFETTGLNVKGYDEPLEITVIDGEGNVLINKLLKPYYRDEWEMAQFIHGITPNDVQNAQYPHEILGELKGILESADTVIGYNVRFDLDILKYLGIEWRGNIEDVMELFKPIYRESTGNWRNQKLVICAAYYGYVADSRCHRSLADVKTTLYCYNCIKNGVNGNDPTVESVFKPYIPRLLSYYKRSKVARGNKPYTQEMEKKLLEAIHIFSINSTRKQLKGYINILNDNMATNDVKRLWQYILYLAQGVPVTYRAKIVKQPVGGYLNPRCLEVYDIIPGDEEKVNYSNESIYAFSIGLIVDYMTRLMYEKDKEKVFKLALLGAVKKDIIDQR